MSLHAETTVTELNACMGRAEFPVLAGEISNG